MPNCGRHVMWKRTITNFGMFDFASFSNPDFTPKRKSAFIPPKVKHIHYNEGKEYGHDSVSISEVNDSQNTGEEEERRERRPKLVVEKIKKEEPAQEHANADENVLTVETKEKPSLYVNPQNYPFPYVYGFPAQYAYPPNYTYPANYQYPMQYPFQIQYPNGLPSVQPPVGDQAPLSISAPFLGQGESLKVGRADVPTPQVERPKRGKENEEGASSSEAPEITIDAPFGNQLEPKQEVEKNMEQGEMQPNMEQMQMQMQMPMFDPYTGMPYEMGNTGDSSEFPLPQVGFEKADVSTTALLVQKPLNSKPYIPLLDAKPTPVYDPSGLSIEKPLVNKSLKLQWLPPGVSTKEKVTPKEVIEKSGICIKKKAEIEYEHLVLTMKEHPKVEEEEEKHEQPTMEQILPPPPPSMFKMPVLFPEDESQPQTRQASPAIEPFKLNLARLDGVIDSSTEDTTEAGEQDLEQTMTLEQQAYSEMVKSRQQDVAAPPKMFTTTEPDLSQSMYSAPKMPMMGGDYSNPANTASNAINFPPNPFSSSTFSYSSPSYSEAQKPPTFPFSSSQDIPKAPAFPSFTFSQPIIPDNSNSSSLFIQPGGTPLGSTSQSEATSSQDLLPIPVATQNQEQLAYAELMKQKRDASEFSSDVYGHLESEKPSSVEEPAPEPVKEPVIDNDLDDLLGIV